VSFFSFPPLTRLFPVLVLIPDTDNYFLCMSGATSFLASLDAKIRSSFLRAPPVCSDSLQSRFAPSLRFSSAWLSLKSAWSNTISVLQFVQVFTPLLS
jgi:hypothetical protein